jgi:hypothetical protein
LAAVAPNPTHGPAQIGFDLARTAAVRLEVIDLAGRRIKLLRGAELAPGHYSDVWTGEDDAGHAVAGGIYFVRLLAGSEGISRRTILLR